MTHDTSPTARALLALETIQDQPGISAERLGRRLDVSERAARRYVATLREAGVPIDSERGPYGGYRIGRGLRPAPMVFRSDEVIGLVMAVLDGHHHVADSTDPVGGALAKLLRALPAAIAGQADAVRRTATAAPDRSAARPDPAITTELVDACASHRRARLDYRSEAGGEWSADVDPWSIVVRHGRWYLLCWSHRAAATRAYRVDRIGHVAVLDDTFDPPVDLDPVRLLEEHLAIGWEYAADVVIAAPIGRVAPCVSGTLGRLESLGPDSCRLVGSTSNPTWYAEQLATIPAAFVIEGGAEVRAAARALGQRLIDAADEPAKPLAGRATRFPTVGP